MAEVLAQGGFPLEIRGSFAFVWVGQAEWVAAADHLATYPLFFTEATISNLFSDLLATLDSPEKNPSVYYQLNFLGGHSFFSDATTVKGIRRVCPGHYVKNGVAKPYIDFWSYLGDEPGDPVKFRQTVEQIILEYAQPNENALLLSGGTDSTAIAGITKKLGMEDRFRYIHAYSPLQIYSEKKNVEQIAEEMHLPVHFQEVKYSGDIDEEVSRRQFGFWIENPFPGKRRAVELAGCESRTIFTGEIGDQLFGGPKNPALLNYAFQTKNISAEQVARIWVNLSDSYGRECGTLPSKRVRALSEMDPLAHTAYEELVGNIASNFELMRSRDFLHRILMLNYLIKGPYRMWAYSQDTLSWRHPFADWRLFDLCFRSPSNEKVRDGGVQKWILWNEWKSYLSEIPWRTKKHGFGIPAKDKFYNISGDSNVKSVRTSAQQISGENLFG